jgi:NAD(P)-dependent dehydrogenase (short-subunit alcohol dehydrogenase family)
MQQMSGLFEIGGKTALVTGGAQGMGRMIAEALVRAGAVVYITSRKADICELAAREMAAHGRCVALPGELATPEDVAALVRKFGEHEKALQILVNNAGRTWGAPLEGFPDKAWAGVMAVNVQTPFTLVRDLLPYLKAAGRADDPARVINIGSLAGITAEKLSAYSYSASKAALHHLSRVLAADLAQFHIAVNTIAPGYFPTQMTSHIQADAQTRAALEARIPLHRLGTPPDIAGACIFLASRAGAYVTGAEIPVDGGLSGCR